jgi:hypothetical protein
VYQRDWLDCINEIGLAAVVVLAGLNVDAAAGGFV